MHLAPPLRCDRRKAGTRSPPGRTCSFRLRDTGSPAGAATHPVVQARLKAGAPNDPYEHEADRVSRMVSRPEGVRAITLSASAPIVQRKCAACASSRGLCAECADEERVQTKLFVGTNNDPFEREADRVADQVMAAPPPPAPCEVPLSIQRFSGRSIEQTSPGLTNVERTLAGAGRPLHPRLRQDMERRLGHDFSPVRVYSGGIAGQSARDLAEKASAPDRIEEVNGQVNLEIRKAAGGGMPMPKSVRHFFEPRFGHDFSRVRIHTGRTAASIAQGIQAAAFAFGSDIFFNTGEYRPDIGTGLGLLAHELAHTVQQQSGGVSRRLIQRAIIPYRPITWADFLATPPANQNPAEGAGILSKFDLIPSYTPVITAKPTKKTCKVGKVRAKEVETTAAPDPADFNKPEAVMDQDQSWALPRYKGNGNDFCAGEVTRCENEFDNIRVTVRANCEKSAGECEQAFDHGEKAFGIALGGDSVRVTRKADCRTTFLTRCQEIISRAATVKIGSTTVSTKEDCKRSYFRQCLVSEVDERARLLRHEQGHFDITNVMARNARDSIRVKAASLSVKETGCGEDAARDAARKTYDTNVGSVLRQLGNDWLAAKDRAQIDYDAQTTHSANAAKQRAWELDIIAGLKAYIPANAPVAAPSQAPASPPATPAPSNPPPAPPPSATPKR